MQRSAESLRSVPEMSVGIKLNREVTMKAGNETKTDKWTMKLNARLNLTCRLIVAAVAGGLLVAPLTRAHR